MTDWKFLKTPAFWVPTIITIVVTVSGGLLFVRNQTTIYNYGNSTLADLNLFYHDSTGRYYTSREKEYLEMAIAYSHLLISNGSFEEAVNILNKAIENDFSFYGIWINLGNAFGQLGRLEDALGSYNEAIRKSSSSTLAWTNKCNLLKFLNRLEEYSDCQEILSMLNNK